MQPSEGKGNTFRKRNNLKIKKNLFSIYQNNCFLNKLPSVSINKILKFKSRSILKITIIPKNSLPLTIRTTYGELPSVILRKLLKINSYKYLTSPIIFRIRSITHLFRTREVCLEINPLIIQLIRQWSSKLLIFFIRR